MQVYLNIWQRQMYLEKMTTSEYIKAFVTDSIIIDIEEVNSARKI